MRTLLLTVLAALLFLPGSGQAETLYFIYVDHLNTPRLAIGEDGVERWRWDNAEPFGNNPPIEVMGTEGYLINLPLRFPGQYADKETNLHYNYFRDYDPGIGRYIQSDPIGLRGGINGYAYVDSVGIPLGPELNTYRYARGNPLRWTDPTGLDVTITYFPGGPGHVGIGVNSPNTSGLYPQSRSVGMVICRDVPGAVIADQERQDATSRAGSRSVTIKTTSVQDAVVQSFIDAARNNAQQDYNLCNNQCTGFVRDALRTGGIPVPGDGGSIVPRTYFDQIERAYGRQQR